MDAVVPLSAPAHRPVRVFMIALALVTALGWAWALDLAAAGHHGLGWLPRVLMWATMMVGMMVPPEVPMLLGLARDQAAGRWSAVGRASVVLGGYLAVWTAASMALALLDARLGAWGLMTHDMASRSVPLDVAILVAAGAAQLSPWKRTCLARCRAISAEVRAGVANPLGSGVRHGVASVCSCGLLMLVLLVVGAMNVLAMMLLTVFLLAERVVPASRVRVLGGLAGIGLLAWGGWLALGAAVG